MYAIKYPHFISLSTITKIVLCSCLVIGSFNFGNFIIKSYNITSHGFSSTLIGYSPPYGLCLISLFL